MTNYKCPICKQVVKRESEKAWIKSYCSKSGKYTRIIKERDPMKLYFTDMDNYGCYPVSTIKEMMEAEGRTEVKATKAKRITGGDYFYCRHFQTVGDKWEGSCGKQCEAYKARNGKSGRCVNSGYCYDYTEKVITITR